MKQDVKNPRASAAAGAKKRSNLSRRVLPALIASCFACAPAWANPTGAQIVTGQVNITNNGKVLTVTNSPGSIINWQNFSIGPGELTQFLQQSANSAVLNRIVGQNPSQIFGALQSNGKVYLINPNGIMFGGGAQVNVGGLVASSLNISNADFTAGKLNFTAPAGGAGSVVNQGSINSPNGGNIYLIAPQVQNTGIITSPQGEVLLAAGHSVQLVDGGDPNLQVTVSAPADQAINLGQVIAQGGKVGIYGALVNQGGTVSADSAVAGQHGEILFKSSQTTLLSGDSRTSATGVGGGGAVYLLGPQVGLTDTAMVNVSGQTGGGTILVGGDYHGNNPAIENARATYVGADTVLKADALQSGDGGKVIVWADNATRSYGTISAEGGALGGNGGFVENSSGKNMDFRANVNVSAANGKGGTLLLDPATITIVGGTGDGAADGTGTFQGSPSGTVGTVLFSDTGPTTIYQSELQGLPASTNIVLQATDYISTSGTFTGAGSGGTLLLPSGSNLTLNTRNSSTDGTGTIGIDLTTSVGGTNLAIQTQGGSITMMTGTGSSPQAAGIKSVALATGGGTVNMGASGNITTGGISTNGGAVNISAAGNVTTAGINTYGAPNPGGNVGISAGGYLSIGQTIDTHGYLATGSGNIGLMAGTGIGVLPQINAPGSTVAISTATGNITQSGLGPPGITANAVSAVALSGAVSLNSEYNAVSVVAGSANSTSGFLFNDGNAFTIGAVPGAGPVPPFIGISSLLGTTYSIQLGVPIGTGGIAIDGPVNAGTYGALLNSGTGAITQVSGDQVTANMLTLSSGANIGTVGSPVLTNLGAGGLFSTASGNIYVNNGTSALNLYHAASSVGTVNINSVGALTIPSCGMDSGDCVVAAGVSLTSQGAINVALTPSFNSINTGSGPITLNSGYNYATTTYVAGSATTISGVLVSSGNITLNAGGAISYTGCPSPAICNAYLYAAPVTVIDLTVSGETASGKIYDGTTNATLTGGSLVGVAPGDTVVLTEGGSFATKNVGNGIAVTAADTITVTGNASGDTYVLIQPTGLTANITPAPLTVTGQSAGSKIYNGNTLASISGGTLAGTVYKGDVVTLSTAGSGNFASKNVGTNIPVTLSTPDTLGGADAGNYMLTQPTLTANISAATVTVAGQTANSKTYDGTTAATLAGGTLTGVIPGDVVTLNGNGSFATKNAGSNIAVTAQDSLGGADSGNYLLAQQPTGLTANITQLGIAVAATGSDKVYNGSTADVVTLSSTGVLKGDTVTFSYTAANFANANSTNLNSKVVTVTGISASGADAGNYTFASTATTYALITPAPLTVTGEIAQNKVYDGSTTATLIGGTLNGVLATDAANVTLTQAGNFASANIGNGISVVAADSLTGSASLNYRLVQPTGLMANIVGATVVTQAMPTLLASNSYIGAINTLSTTLLNGGNPSGSGSPNGNNNSGERSNENGNKLYCN